MWLLWLVRWEQRLQATTRKETKSVANFINFLPSLFVSFKVTDSIGMSEVSALAVGVWNADSSTLLGSAFYLADYIANKMTIVVPENRQIRTWIFSLPGSSGHSCHLHGWHHKEYGQQRDLHPIGKPERTKTVWYDSLFLEYLTGYLHFATSQIKCSLSWLLFSWGVIGLLRINSCKNDAFLYCHTSHQNTSEIWSGMGYPGPGEMFVSKHQFISSSLPITVIFLFKINSQLVDWLRLSNRSNNGFCSNDKSLLKFWSNLLGLHQHGKHPTFFLLVPMNCSVFFCFLFERLLPLLFQQLSITHFRFRLWQRKSGAIIFFITT